MVVGEEGGRDGKKRFLCYLRMSDINPSTVFRLSKKEPKQSTYTHTLTLTRTRNHSWELKKYSCRWYEKSSMVSRSLSFIRSPFCFRLVRSVNGFGVALHSETSRDDPISCWTIHKSAPHKKKKKKKRTQMHINNNKRSQRIHSLVVSII